MALGQSQSVYVAELVGVRSAIDSLALMLPSYPSNTPLPAHLFLDNQSAVRNSCSSDATPGQSLRLDIHQRYRRLIHAHPHLQLTLHWIPGHEGVEGNEAADEAAKAAALTAVSGEEGGQEEEEEGNVDVSLAGELPKSRSAVRAVFELLLPALWDSYWRSPDSGGAALRRVDLHQPSKHVLRLHDGLPRSLSSLLTQLRTGHSHLLADRFRSRTSHTDRCECGAPETLSHFLLSCPLYRTQRANLAKAVGSQYRNLPLLMTDPAVVPLTLDFVLATGRFSRYHLKWSAAEEAKRRKERRKAKKGERGKGKGGSKARG